MFKRASSRLVRTGSKESKDSDLSAAYEDFVVRVGRATKTGTLHANEDRCTVLESLTDVLDEEVVTVSEMLEFDLKSSGDLLEKLVYVGVFDGHGGPGCASFVARNLHQRVAKHLEQGGVSALDGECAKAVRRAFVEVEDEFATYWKVSGDTSGACAAVALISGKGVMFAHCGDCRAVLRTNGETKEVTKDHRAEDPEEKSRILANGGQVIEGRVNGVLAPSRGFGDFDVKTTLTSKNVLIVDPDVSVHAVDVLPGKKIASFVVVATDGLWDVMDPNEACNFVERILSKTGSADVAAQRLVETASKNNHDDVTVVVAAWEYLKPKKTGSKLQLREGGSREASGATGAGEDFDVSLLASPKVKGKRTGKEGDAKLFKR